MIWVRKFLSNLLALFLLLVLIATALTTSLSLTLTKPAKVENWLNQSNLYNQFVAEITKQSEQTLGHYTNTTLAVSNADLQKDVQTAFPPQLVHTDVDLFITSNYAWLEGKTKLPSFSINLLNAKEKFASEIGNYVLDHFTSLPVCASTESLALQTTFNPLTISCRSPFITATDAAAVIETEVTNSTGFLNDPVLTADNINPHSNSTSEPYYKKLSQLPKAYQHAQKAPFLLAAGSLVLALIILFMSTSKRKGLYKISGALLISGFALVAVALASTAVYAHAQAHIFATGSVGQLQQSLTNFLRLAIKALANVDFYFGIAYGSIAAVLFVLLIAYHGHSRHVESAPREIPQGPAPVRNEQAPLPQLKTPQTSSMPVMDIVSGPPALKPRAAQLPLRPMQPGSQKPKRPRRPRLIQ